MENTHTLRTFFDDCALTLRYEGDTAHFEFWFPKKSEPHWIATLPAIGGAISWAPSVGELIKDCDEGRGEMSPDGCLEDIRSIVEDFAALQGDRRGYTWNDTSGFWEEKKFFIQVDRIKKYPLLKQTEHAFDMNALGKACAVLEDEQLYDLHHLLCCDFDHDAKSLDGIAWTVTPANTEREEYKVTASVSDLVTMLRQSYGFLTCVGWNTLDCRVGCSDVYLYGYFVKD